MKQVIIAYPNENWTAGSHRIVGRGHPHHLRAASAEAECEGAGFTESTTEEL